MARGRCILGAIPTWLRRTVTLPAPPTPRVGRSTTASPRTGPRQLLSGYAAPHRSRIEAARERVAADLGPEAYEAARQLGAAMTYDEIVAVTLDQLARIAEQ